MTTTFRFSPGALDNIQETGIDPQDDLDALRRGEHTTETLFAHCLDGADDDRVQGWRDYVSALAAKL